MPPFSRTLWRSLRLSPFERRYIAQVSRKYTFAALRQFHTPLARRLAPGRLNFSAYRNLLRSGRRPYSEAPKGNGKSHFKPEAKQPQGNLPPTGPASSAPDASLSLSARLRKLSREYGWSAFGVYMALTALDFPFCFLAVRQLGTERVGEWEHKIVSWVKRAIPVQWPEKWSGPKKSVPDEPAADGSAAALLYDHGVREADLANSGEAASIWTQLALAYAIHKSFIFVRVPLTAAITPKIVRTLRGWGWNIGKVKPKAERVAARAEKKAAKAQKKVQEEAAKAAREAEKRLD